MPLSTVDHGLKELDDRLDKERIALIECLVVGPKDEELPNELLQRLATVVIAREAIAHEIASHEVRLGCGASL